MCDANEDDDEECLASTAELASSTVVNNMNNAHGIDNADAEDAV